jgi:hypothetical protein
VLRQLEVGERRVVVERPLRGHLVGAGRVGRLVSEGRRKREGQCQEDDGTERVGLGGVRTRSHEARRGWGGRPYK